MKNLRIAFLGLVLIAATAFSTSAQTIKYAIFQGPSAFVNGTTVTADKDMLNDELNWSALQATDPGTSSGTKLDNIKISYTHGVAPNADGNLTNFYQALRDKYDLTNSFVVSPSTFTITAFVSGSNRTYTITVRLKS